MHGYPTPSKNENAKMTANLDVRKDFPALSVPMNGKPLAFLDTAASAQKPQAVIDAMNAVLESGYSNIHRGLYHISQQLTADFEAVRAKTARFLGASSEKEIVLLKIRPKVSIWWRKAGGVRTLG